MENTNGQANGQVPAAKVPVTKKTPAVKVPKAPKVKAPRKPTEYLLLDCRGGESGISVLFKGNSEKELIALARKEEIKTPLMTVRVLKSFTPKVETKTVWKV